MGQKQKGATTRWNPLHPAFYGIIMSDPTLSTWGHGIGQVHNRAFLSCKHPCQKLNMPPARSTGRGVGKPSEPPLQPDPWIRPTTLTPYKKKQLPFQGASKQGNLLTHSCSPPATAGALINPCLKKEKKNST